MARKNGFRETITQPGARVLENPNCKVAEDFLSPDQASRWLVDRGFPKMTVGALATRRQFGRAPAFFKLAGFAIGYRVRDLEAFLRQAGMVTPARRSKAEVVAGADSTAPH